MVAVDDRLLLVDVDGGVAGPALAQRREQRPGAMISARADVHDQRGRLHARRSTGTDDPAVSRVRRTCSDSTSERSNSSSLLAARA